jgi:hypothetical protein
MSGVILERQIRVYGAGSPNEPKFWEHNITADVNQTCGALFGPVFDRYNYVCIFSTEATAYNGIPDHQLQGDTYLLSTMCNLNMNLREGVVEIWAENK